ncbi:MAG: HD domain-containing protein [Ruminococcaceae bacterium]|nr:HD domain-containing protein [Oscillospiraceae bacterium]
MQDLDFLEKEVVARVSKKRARHVMGVKEELTYLCQAFELSQKDTNGMLAAALLHDITKEDDMALQLETVRAHGLVPSEDDVKSVYTFHALSGYVLCRDQYKLDSDFALAVLHHSTGGEDLSLFDKLLYVADYIEEGRGYPDCMKMRNFVHQGIDNADNFKERLEILDQAVYNIADNTVKFLVERDMYLHPNTPLMRDYYKPHGKGRL